MVLRSRYWLYYALVFMSGARRQIFTVFAGFLMVEKFSYSVSDISLLFLFNATLNVLFARRIGRLIAAFGERNALLLEYSGLILVFCGYALVETGWIAAGLYVLDHLFFALAISLKTYFQKIAAPEDILIYRRGEFYHQPYCRRGDSGDLRTDLAPLTDPGFFHRRSDGLDFPLAVAVNPALSGAGERDLPVRRSDHPGGATSIINRPPGSRVDLNNI